MLERERALIPLNPRALAVAQNSKKRLEQMYIGEHVLTCDGEISAIRKIEVGNFYGNSFRKWLLSALTGVRSIRVELEKLPRLSLDELKKIVVRFITYDAQTPEPLLVPQELLMRTIQSIEKANSVDEIFRALNIPSLEDCLDVL